MGLGILTRMWHRLFHFCINNNNTKIHKQEGCRALGRKVLLVFGTVV